MLSAGSSSQLPGDIIYYDYLEDGALKGGFIEADPANPYHAALGPTEAAGRWEVTTVIDNGPTANRIDLVLVGDGYTAAELRTYADHVDNLLSTFFGESPLDAYSTFFNVHRVDVISNESGVDHDPTEGIFRDTALDMRFFCSDTERLLCVNVGKALTAAAEAPDVDQVLALANSTKYGGAGYPSSDLGTLSGGNSSAIQIGLHEFGHSFADLADEYDYGDDPTYTGPEPDAPNVSIYDAAAMAGRRTKWHRWLDEPNVDTFEGAMYHKFGIYRPTNNSKMQSLNRPFRQVNVEQFVLGAYETVRPIDDATPPGTYQQDTVFFVDPVVLNLDAPATHSLDVQWSLDGDPIAGAVGTTLDAASLGPVFGITLPPGTYTLAVEVVDATDLVRDEAQRDLLMTDQRSWTLEVVVAAEVVGRHVFYNHSAFDDPPSGGTDDDAIAPDKQALLGGAAAGFANYTSYSRGINGIMVDIAAAAATPTEADFEFRVGNDDTPAGWDEAPKPSSFGVRPAPSPQYSAADGSDRVTIIWADNDIENQWLQVTVLPGNIGLPEPDVFYFGNAAGESGNSTGDAKVNALDMLGARDNPRTFLDPAPIDFRFDYNRDARVDATDMLIARNNPTHFLNALRLIEVAPQPQPKPKAPPGKDNLAWLAQFEQIGTRRPPQTNDFSRVLRAAVERLLATWGQ